MNKYEQWKKDEEERWNKGWLNPRLTHNCAMDVMLTPEEKAANPDMYYKY